MSRVSPVEVKDILSTPLIDSVIQTFIDAANTIVTQNSSCIGGDEDLLTKVELYLSAHYVGMLDPAIRGFITKEKITSEFETNYSNPVNVKNNIDNTTYGTLANTLSNGCLAKTSDRAISFSALGGGDNGC